MLKYLVISLFFMGASFGPNPQDVTVATVYEVFKSGQIDNIYPQLGDEVLLDLDGKDFFLDQKEAFTKLNNYWRELEPKAFRLKHKGKSRDGSVFALGELQASSTVFRVYYVIKDDRITEISIGLD